jgi:hypothetical protein
VVELDRFILERDQFIATDEARHRASGHARLQFTFPNRRIIGIPSLG